MKELIFDHPDMHSNVNKPDKPAKLYITACSLLNADADGYIPAMSSALRLATRAHPELDVVTIFGNAVSGCELSAMILVELVAEGLDMKVEFAKSLGEKTISF